MVRVSRLYPETIAATLSHHAEPIRLVMIDSFELI
jgi:hypothetical protein